MAPWEKYQQPTPPQGAVGPWAKYVSPDAQQMGTGEDVARSAVSGVGEGGIGLMGLPGDVQGLVNRGMDWLMGTTPEEQAKMAQYGQTMPTSGQLMDVAQGAGVQFHEPQTTAGEYARTAGQFLPGSLVGPGGMATKLASGAAGALGSETAGQLTEGTGAEPYARFVGGVLAGGGTAAALRKPSTAAPTTAQLKQTADNLYTQARNSGATVPAPVYSQILDDVGNAAIQGGANKRLTPMAYAAMRELERNEGLPKSVADLEVMRRNLKMASGSPNAQERMLAKRMVQEFDTGVERHAPSSMSDARKAYAQFKRSELTDDLRSGAELRAGQYSQSGMENALRTEYRQLARNKNKMRQFSPEEQEAIRKVATGGKIENAARWAGKFAPTGPVSATTSILGALGGGAYIGGPAGAAVGATIAGTGLAAKKLATALTNRNVKLAEELIRRGPTQIQSYKGQQRQKLIEMIARALMSGESSQAPRVEAQP